MYLIRIMNLILFVLSIEFLIFLIKFNLCTGIIILEDQKVEFFYMRFL